MATRRESNRFRSRAAKGRERTKGRAETDAIAVALTAQIIICILILLAAQIARRTDSPRFAQIKHEYVNLVGASENGSLSDYFDELSGLPGGFFDLVENIIQGLLRRGQSQTWQAPGLYSDLEIEQMGMGGGSSPVHFSGNAYDMLPAPEGTTLAPFFLSGQLRPPLTGIITSPFAFRVHPLSGNLDFHSGIDIAAPHGRGILAALPGYVERVGENDIYGKYVMLRHAHNLQTLYAHCSYIFVREGMRVNQGERIARVGDTGMATGPHLHFSVIVDGLYADPLHALGRYVRLVE